MSATMIGESSLNNEYDNIDNKPIDINEPTPKRGYKWTHIGHGFGVWSEGIKLMEQKMTSEKKQLCIFTGEIVKRSNLTPTSLIGVSL